MVKNEATDGVDVTVRLSAATIEWAKEYGGGNVTTGVRRAIESFRDYDEDCRDLAASYMKNLR